MKTHNLSSHQEIIYQQLIELYFDWAKPYFKQPSYFPLKYTYPICIYPFKLGSTILVREVWLGNITSNIDEEKLREEMAYFGEVENTEFY